LLALCNRGEWTKIQKELFNKKENFKTKEENLTSSALKERVF
jgi:hypothetical protein